MYQPTNQSILYTQEHIKHGRYRLAGSEWILHVPHAKHELDSVQAQILKSPLYSGFVWSKYSRTDFVECVQTGSSISSLAQPVLSSVVKCEFDAPSYPLEV